MTPEELAYLKSRAQAELELAQKAEHPAAVRAHHQLAESYLERIRASAGQQLGSQVRSSISS